MKPPKRSLLAAIILDTLLIAGSLFVMGHRFYSLGKQQAVFPPVEVPAKPALVPTAQGPEKAPPPDRVSKRKILFQFRNSKPKTVEVAGDFNDWAPILMSKDPASNWTASLEIAPGEYTYNFLVDGVPIRDPNNPKTKDGRSLLVVKPIP